MQALCMSLIPGPGSHPPPLLSWDFLQYNETACFPSSSPSLLFHLFFSSIYLPVPIPLCLCMYVFMWFPRTCVWMYAPVSPLAEESEEGIVCPVLSFIFCIILSLNLDISWETASFRNPPVSPHSP